MIKYAAYDLQTGQILRTGQCTEETISMQVQPGEGVLKVDAHVKDSTHFVDLQTLRCVEYPPAAQQELLRYPGPGFRWSPVDGKWIDERTHDERVQAEWARIRKRRDELLKASDVAILRVIERGEVPPNSLVEYRQALRDLPLQGDPFNVVWPELDD